MAGVSSLRTEKYCPVSYDFGHSRDVRRVLRSSAFVGIFALGSWASVGLAKGTSAAKESPSVVTYSGMAVHENRGVTLRVEMSRAVRYRH